MPNHPTLQLISLGLLYFAIAFCVGVVIGILRVLLVAPQIGAIAALLLELPIILTLLWHASRTIYFHGTAKNYSLPALTFSGSVALMTLLLAEWLLRLFVLDQTGEEVLRNWTTIDGMIGLAAQNLFGIIPTLQGILIRKSRSHTS